MRRTWWVDRDQAHHPYVFLEGGSGSGVRRSGGKGFSGFRGLGQTDVQDTMTVTISIKHVREGARSNVQCPLYVIHCALPDS